MFGIFNVKKVVCYLNVFVMVLLMSNFVILLSVVFKEQMVSVCDSFVFLKQLEIIEWEGGELFVLLILMFMWVRNNVQKFVVNLYRVVVVD